MTRISFDIASTMLPQTERNTLTFGVNDDIEDSANILKALCAARPDAAFRIESVTVSPSSTQRYVDWFIEQNKENTSFKKYPHLFLAAIILAAEFANDNDTSAAGMLVYGTYYADHYADDDTKSFLSCCRDAIRDEEYRVCFAEDEATAYEEFGKESEGEDTPGVVYDYVDWEGVGRDCCDGGLRDWDNEFAVWKEWH